MPSGHRRNAAELNINGVSDYAASPVRSPATLFSDVYQLGLQALAGLVETYGCVAGTPTAPSVATVP